MRSEHTAARIVLARLVVVGAVAHVRLPAAVAPVADPGRFTSLATAESADRGDCSGRSTRSPR